MTTATTMRFLLMMLLLNAPRTFGLYIPVASVRRRSWFGTCEREQARNSLDSWVVTMLERGRMYPGSSYTSSYDAIDYINTDKSQLGLLTWNHVYHDDYHIVSHIILTQSSQDEQALAICGIVENPDNVIYNKSIIPMMENLVRKMSKTNTTVVLDPLIEWNYGIYFASLTTKL